MTALDNLRESRIIELCFDGKHEDFRDRRHTVLNYLLLEVECATDDSDCVVVQIAAVLLKLRVHVY